MQEKIECVRLLTNLQLPLVRMAVAKVAPKNTTAEGAKWRRIPCEKWKGKLRIDRAPESFHDCNVAVQTGHALPDGRYLYILDIDLKKREGVEQWKNILDQHGDPEFWAGAMSRTETGGLHLWFASSKQYNVQLGLWPGIDFLGLGALSFEPPSRFSENGTLCREYMWETAPTTAEHIPELPRWVTNEVEIREIKAKSFKEMKESSDAQYAMGVQENCLPFIEACLSRYTPEAGLEYSQWLRLGMGLHQGAGGSDLALSIFDSWGARVASEKGGDYDEKKTRVTWDSFGSRENQITYGTFVKLLCEDKAVSNYLKEIIEECATVFSSVAGSGDSVVTSESSSEAATKGRGHVVEHLTMERLMVAVSVSLNNPLIQTNMTNGAIEITFPGEEMRRMDQPTEDRIVLTCLDFGKSKKIKPLTKEKFVVRAINLIADKSKYHPVKEYLNKCLEEYRAQQESSRKDDIIDKMRGISYTPGKKYREKLCAGINLPPGKDAEWFKKSMDHWLHGAICKVFFGYQNPMLVLQGGQGVGKSTLARALVKKIGTSYYYAGAIDPNDKDHKMKLAQLFLWEPDELGGTTAYADINRLKSLLTLTRVNERPPYGRYVVDMDVVCSFLGTTNDASFLTDTTGSRRFLVAKFEPVSPMETINWLRGVEFDPNLLWGEVYDEVLRTGDKAPMLGQEDLAEAISRAESVRKRDDIEVVLEDLLEVQPVGERPTEEWRLYRKDLRTALSDADVRLGRGTMRQAGEIIAKLVGFRDHWDAMGNINGERYFRRVRLRSSIIPPPTFPTNKN